MALCNIESNKRTTICIEYAFTLKPYIFLFYATIYIQGAVSMIRTTPEESQLFGAKPIVDKKTDYNEDIGFKYQGMSI